MAAATLQQPVGSVPNGFRMAAAVCALPDSARALSVQGTAIDNPARSGAARILPEWGIVRQPCYGQINIASG
jgi:hypothetical protein